MWHKFQACKKTTKIATYSGLALVLIASLALALAKPAKTQHEQLGSDYYDLFAPYIEGFTEGAVSRGSTISLEFAQDMPQDIENVLSFDPPLRGELRWASSRRLDFIPAAPLASDQSYQGSLQLGELIYVPSEQSVFRFTFQTPVLVAQFRDIALSRDLSQKGDFYTVSGQLYFNDFIQSENVEKDFQAKGPGQLDITWQHSRDSHSFSIRNIERKETNGSLNLAWSGKSVPASEGTEIEVEVKGYGVFQVLTSSFDKDNEVVTISFTNDLAQQNLAGKITVDPPVDNMRFNATGNSLNIYSDAWPKNTFTVKLAAGIEDERSRKLGDIPALPFADKAQKPTLKLLGSGNILPSNGKMFLPIETLNLKSVVVELVNIKEERMLQYLQDGYYNQSSDSALRKVASVIWRQRMDLNWKSENYNSKLQTGLDLSPIAKNFPRGMFQLRVFFTMYDVVYPGAEPSKQNLPNITELSISDGARLLDAAQESSNWDYYSEDGDYQYYYNNRDNPTTWAYYTNSNRSYKYKKRNLMLSNIGIIAQRSQDGTYYVATSNLSTGKALSGVKIEAFDYVQNKLVETSSSQSGLAQFQITSPRSAFFIKASYGDMASYMRSSESEVLATSSFDVAGQSSNASMRGFIYGERDVWRPGDEIHLGFILRSDKMSIPNSYPVQLRFYNPERKLYSEQNSSNGLSGFYAFTLKTAESDRTGNWLVRINAGAAVFEKVLPIQTIVPNRLKIETKITRAQDSSEGQERQVLAVESPERASIESSWLHGSPASNLEAKVDLVVTSGKTSFSRYPNYVFDDYRQEFSRLQEQVFDGKLDEQGKAEFSFDLNLPRKGPGFLRAELQSRVYEPGGAFSQVNTQYTYGVYPQYVGILTPKGDAQRNMLLTDEDHELQIVLLDRTGKALSGNLQVSLIKLNWRWWWEQEAYKLLSSNTEEHRTLLRESVNVTNGKGSFRFQVKYPEWGRYLIRVQDPQGGHSASQVVYIDWPGWASRASEAAVDSAAVLSFSSSQQRYQLGETIDLSFPNPGDGSLLIAVERNGQVIKQDWLDGKGPSNKQLTYSLKATAEMAPNIYVHAMLLQGHSQEENDRPVRMYGVIPIMVEDPATHLEPLILSADVFEPNANAQLRIKEAKGKAMTYTLALVDEGLLNISNFQTPQPWQHFYQKEASRLQTWDIFKYVLSARGVSISQLLAIGGDLALQRNNNDKNKRFPPVVRYLGPFELKAGAEATHNVDIPQYFGALQVMLVAAGEKSYGSAEKEVQVKSPLMVLGTAPRKLNYNDKFALPVTVFALDPKVRNVQIEVTSDGPLRLQGDGRAQLSFTSVGDQVANIQMEALAQTGQAKIEIVARGGGETARHSIVLDVSNPSLPVNYQFTQEIRGGSSWDVTQLDGLPKLDDASLSLDISTVGNLNFGDRLNQLLSYPHGCIEQTTSKAFAQLYLAQLFELSDEQLQKQQYNLNEAIARISSFQTLEGGFSYWPDQSQNNAWGTNYAGHFLVEAKNSGYLVNPDVLSQWLNYQKVQARAWRSGTQEEREIQAYRLFTIALAGQPELAAMNRLNENQNQLSTMPRMMLLASYNLSGLESEADKLFQPSLLERWRSYVKPGASYGSSERDQAMSLYALSTMKTPPRSANALADLLKTALVKPQAYYSTQTNAWMLIALSKWYTRSTSGNGMQYSYTYNGKQLQVNSRKNFSKQELASTYRNGEKLLIQNPQSSSLYANVNVSGKPQAGQETARANGLSLNIRYFDQQSSAGRELSPEQISKLPQGSSFLLQATVRNSTTSELDDVALSLPLPSGWEYLGLVEELANQDQASSLNYDYRDIRDDRAMIYFKLKASESKTFSMSVHASYRGSYYLPFSYAESMYQPQFNALIAGQNVEVVPAE